MPWDYELSSDRCQYCRTQIPHLIRCCKCYKAYHNSCLDPPIKYVEILNNFICKDCLKCEYIIFIYSSCDVKLTEYNPKILRNKLVYYCNDCVYIFYYYRLIIL